MDRLKLYKRLFSSFGMMGLGTGLGFIVHIGLAHLLDAHEYGVYNFIYSVAMIVCLVALMGMSSAITRFIASYHIDDMQRHKIRQVIGFSVIFTSILGLILGAIVFAVMALSGKAHEYGNVALFVGFLSVVPMTLIRQNSGILRGFHKTTASVAYETVAREAGMLAIVIGLYALGIKLTSGVGALLVMCVALTIAITLSFYQIYKLLPPKADTHPKQSIEDWKEWISVSFPMMLMAAFQRLMKRIDLIFIGLMLGPAEAGIYALMVNFADGSTIASKAALSVFAPKIAADFAKGDHASMRKDYNLARLFIASTSIIAALILIFAGGFIIPLIGEQYMEGYNTLLIFLGFYVFTVLWGPASNVMMMTRYEKQAMWQTKATAILNIALNPILIYHFGMEGAAFATGLSIMTRNLLSCHFVYKKGVLKPHE
ncbi:MAG: hypothetical protein CMH26_04300 [Micavibrio sp.]|nr:hypothetical protein [Micavibrio sp.]